MAPIHVEAGCPRCKGDLEYNPYERAYLCAGDGCTYRRDTAPSANGNGHAAATGDNRRDDDRANPRPSSGFLTKAELAERWGVALPTVDARLKEAKITTETRDGRAVVRAEHVQHIVGRKRGPYEKGEGKVHRAPPAVAPAPSPEPSRSAGALRLLCLLDALAEIDATLNDAEGENAALVVGVLVKRALATDRLLAGKGE